MSVACRVCMSVSPDGSAFCGSCGAPLGATPSLTPATTVRPRPTPPGTDALVGRVVAGRFKVLELLGQGGMGKVYKALHLGLDKVVCIKTLRPALLEDPTIVGRFEREAKAASRLDHANSIHVLDFGQDESGTLFLVMEFVPGRDLRRVLRDEFPLGEARIVKLVAQVLAALSRAHAQGVIHRDLKPENILVTERDGEKDFVKVLDFGIAKIADGSMPGITRQDLICGTPEYMSPEQARGAAFDHRADLYAIGVILYQLATGELPFLGTSAMDTLTKHVNDPLVPVRTKRPEAQVSAAFEDLVARALSKDPAKRPQNADEFRRELLAITAEPATEPEVARVAPKVTKKPVIEDDFDAEAALPKSNAPMWIGILALAAALGGGTWWLLRPPPAPVVEAAPKAPTGAQAMKAAYDVIESHFDDVRKCFEKSSRRLDEDGKVLLSISIGAEGQVDKAGIVETTFNAPKLERCIIERAVLWKFDKPRGGSLGLTYPYIFRRK